MNRQMTTTISDILVTVASWLLDNTYLTITYFSCRLHYFIRVNYLTELIKIVEYTYSYSVQWELNCDQWNSKNNVYCVVIQSMGEELH